VANANALQLVAALATPVLCRFNYDAMPSLMSPNHCRIIAFCCWYITLRCDLDFWLLNLYICSVSSVTWWNSVPYLNAIKQCAAELLRFQCLTLWPWACF